MYACGHGGTHVRGRTVSATVVPVDVSHVAETPIATVLFFVGPLLPVDPPPRTHHRPHTLLPFSLLHPIPLPLLHDILTRPEIHDLETFPSPKPPADVEVKVTGKRKASGKKKAVGTEFPSALTHADLSTTRRSAVSKVCQRVRGRGIRSCAK